MELLKFKDYSLKIKSKNESFILFDNFDCSVRTGDVILLSGPNGSGKSTLLAELTGFDYKYKENECEIERNGMVYYDPENRNIVINKNGYRNAEFSDEYIFISQNDEQAFPLIFDCFRSTLVKKANLLNKSIDLYIFEFVKKYGFYPKNNKKISKLKKHKIHSFLDKINQSSVDNSNILVASYLFSKVDSLSGGQLKMLNIMSNLIKYEFSSICFIDEPLNNLDFESVRLFSNIITKIHNEKSYLAFLIVTHCRSILAVNKILEIDPNNKKIVASDVSFDGCSTCFGKFENKFYI